MVVSKLGAHFLPVGSRFHLVNADLPKARETERETERERERERETPTVYTPYNIVVSILYSIIPILVPNITHGHAAVLGAVLGAGMQGLPNARRRTMAHSADEFQNDTAAVSSLCVIWGVLLGKPSQ